ncbi:hypothetical protein H257_13444 [Aphanomyces astaci]|uniref:Uncharacterized protein n=1 Tax=Aphanomyces astaci TaxID=112090 RepID=W4FWK3_APHAT|nr:hypothetical protein H257_13444 [Aphanomyces astaci]ETV71316.1 hypothetical protein H257_13444 [Aphanomyces astaci]|eukprot:XP_009839256.1 hypothetical protein H257_13444 [Aphanomyces astaci]
MTEAKTQDAPTCHLGNMISNDVGGKKHKAAAKKPGMKKAAMFQCVQDNLAEITEIKAELDKLAQERRFMCRDESIVHVLHLSKQ